MTTQEGGHARAARVSFRHQPGTETDATLLVQRVQVLDVQDRAPGVIRLRQWGLAAAVPAPGDVALDVGCGTGTVARMLADLVGPTGRVTGIEPDEGMRREALRRSTGTSVPIRFVEGLAAALPVADSSVDVVWCERVLQHLEDPQAAVTEVARVLKPGGRAVLLDSDHASWMLADVAERVEDMVKRTFLAGTPNGRAARGIPRQLLTAGLIMDEDVAGAALVLPQQVQRKVSLVRVVADQLVAEGSLSADEAAAALASIARAAEQGVGLSAVTIYAFVGRRPA